MVRQQDNAMAMLPHLLGWFTWIIGPLVLYFVNKEKNDPVVMANTKHALNFQLSMTIYFLVAAILIFVFIGLLLLPALAIFELVVIIIACVRSYHGEMYKYPLEIEFLK
jgi:uncharacterized protein